MEITRGDVVMAVLPKALGKPRPIILVQSDLFNATHATLTLLPVTTDIRDWPLFRILLEPSAQNGLKHISQIMVDKIMSVGRDKIRPAIGRLSDEDMVRVNRALLVWLGIA